MNAKRLAVFSFIFLCGLLLLSYGPQTLFGAEKDVGRPVVYLLDVDGTINPALSDYIIKGIEKAKENNAACVIIRMDTPGGVVTTTKTIIKDMMNAKLPVVVYVAPSGSSATSAGALITMGADVAAMAPGTNIGAAHPVGGGGQQIDAVMSEKVVNDLTAYMRGIVDKKGRNAAWAEKAIRESVSITDKEALANNVIDLIADSVPDLLEKLDGRKIEKEGRFSSFQDKGRASRKNSSRAPFQDSRRHCQSQRRLYPHDDRRARHHDGIVSSGHDLSRCRRRHLSFALLLCPASPSGELRGDSAHNPVGHSLYHGAENSVIRAPLRGSHHQSYAWFRNALRDGRSGHAGIVDGNCADGDHGVRLFHLCARTCSQGVASGNLEPASRASSEKLAWR